MIISAQYMLSSPWTTCLVLAVKQAIGPDDTAHDHFRQVLKRRLGRSGNRIIGQVGAGQMKPADDELRL